MRAVDFVVVGAGIAGASVARELAAHGSVALLEAERVAGFHATGRSAAALTENYGNREIRLLTAASRPFLERPPEGFAPSPLAASRPVLWIARDDQRDALLRAGREAARLVPSIHEIPPAEARGLCPVLREEYLAAALIEPDALDLDVNAIHRGFLRDFRARGGQLRLEAPVRALRSQPRGWRVSAGTETLGAGSVVNAAGAWCDRVAQLAGAGPVGLVPMRRTAIAFDPPAGHDIRSWPLVLDGDEEFYFKPEGARLLASPADETPLEPCDAHPEDYDVALAVDRLQRATTLEIRHIPNRWAGLRSFVADRSPVVGPDPERPGFFWLAGQGGYGIMTSPALARAAAGLLIEGRLPSDLAALGLDAGALAPERLGRPAKERAARPAKERVERGS